MKSLKETNVTECACFNAEYLHIDTKNNCKKVFEYGGGYEYGGGVPCHDSSITESIMINQIYLYGLGYSRQPSLRDTLAEATLGSFLYKIQPADHIMIANPSRGARQLSRLGR